MSRQGVTLRDIAKQADVSVAAVSYVLNGKGGISQPRRRQISQMLEQAGLKPQYLRHPTLYLCAHRSLADMSFHGPFFQKYEGLSSSFDEMDVGLRLAFLNDPGGRNLKTQLNQLLSYRPGAVVLDSDLNDDLAEAAAFFEAKDVPALQVGHTTRADDVEAVVIDDFGGAYTATRHLIEAGHERIATIRWRVGADPASSRKHAAFVCAMNDANLSVRPEYIVESPAKREGSNLTGRVAVAKLLALDEPPTAVFVENSFVSASLLYPVSPAEKQVPPAIQALDMVHFEAWHLDFIEHVMCGVLTYPSRRAKLMRIDWAELGRVAAKQIINRLKGGEPSGQVIRLAPRLVSVDAMRETPL